MSSPCATTTADATDNVPLPGNALADLIAIYIDASIDHLTHELMANDYRGLYRALSPSIKSVNMEVGTTDRRSIYLNQEIVIPTLRNGGLL
jgi:hypothetical protein